MNRIIQNKNMNFVVFCLLLYRIGSLNCWASDPSYTPSLKSWLFSPVNISHYKGTLRASGYDVNSVEDIKRATTDDKLTVRDRALYLLAYKIGHEAIPNLKDALNDTYPYVRCTTARLLGILGDRSGLEIMRRDMLEFTKDIDEKVPLDKDAPLGLRTKGGRLLYALQAAQVLAEFGDCSCYQLAVKTAMEENSALKRTIAITILSELGRIDKAKLKETGLDPEAVLLLVAEKEADHRVLESLIACVRTNMRPEPTIRILEKVQNSPHIKDNQRQRVKSGLKRIRERVEKEKQTRTENKN